MASVHSAEALRLDQRVFSAINHKGRAGVNPRAKVTVKASIKSQCRIVYFINSAALLNCARLAAGATDECCDCNLLTQELWLHTSGEPVNNGFKSVDRRSCSGLTEHFGQVGHNKQ